MPRYITKPQAISRRIAAMYDYSSDHGETEGREVYDDWSEDRPTGVLSADGSMIYRVANQIGFLADPQ